MENVYLKSIKRFHILSDIKNITFSFSENINIIMNENFVVRINSELQEIEAAGLFKKERIIESPQGAEILVNGKTVLNFCANNYLGLSSHPKVIEAAKATVDKRGYGMSSVRFICGISMRPQRAGRRSRRS